MFGSDTSSFRTKDDPLDGIKEESSYLKSSKGKEKSRLSGKESAKRDKSKTASKKD